MSLTLYNTLTRRKERFEPIDPSNVRMYVCGPTVYDDAHIGNARPVIIFDVLFRLLRHLYGTEQVTYARNITDVDDKIIERAAQEGVAIDALTERTARQFHEDVAALGCLPPTHEPRATEHIGAMIAMIARLIERGCAYEAEGHVLFHVAAMPDYGRLAWRPLDEMRAGARVEVAPYKRDPMDFVLWKPAREGEPGWDSPWGFGRPGWHIECSAMSAALLGETFDIHGGGIDLVFPHHENEVAQSRCAHGTEIMARYWLHNGFLQVEGEKMSKSSGNFVTINDLLHTDKFGGRKWPGEVLRLAMLMTHYTKPIDWTVNKLLEAERILKRWRRRLEGVETVPADPDSAFVAALSDDLNTPAAIDRLHELFHLPGHWSHPDDPEGLGEGALGSGPGYEGFSDPDAYRQAASLAVATLAFLGIEPVRARPQDAHVQSLIAARNEARKRKDFAEADRIRDELAAVGIVLMDGKDPETGEPTTRWDVAR